MRAHGLRVQDFRFYIGLKCLKLLVWLDRGATDVFSESLVPVRVGGFSASEWGFKGLYKSSSKVL